MEKSEERKIHIDLLRIVACFSVIMLHSAAQYWYDLPVSSTRWLVCNTYDGLFRFGVPVFVMISGMLFLGKEGKTDVKKLYRNNILRLACAYVTWSILYGLWDCRTWFGNTEVGWKKYVSEMLLGRYHLWFVPMLIGIYMLLPVLKEMTDHCSKKQIEYFLCLFFILQIGRRTLDIVTIPNVVKDFSDRLDVEMVCSYVGYFILGYYLHRFVPSQRKRKLLYVLGILGLLLAPIVSNVLSVRKEEPLSASYDSFSIFTFLASVAVFVFFEQVVSKVRWKQWMRKGILEFSANSFGVYLMHILVFEMLQAKGIDSMSIDSLAGIPLLAVVCFILCNIAISLLRRVPVLGKYTC